MGAWIPIQTQCQERAGQTGHRNAQVQNGYLCQRLFLARSQGLQAVCIAENQHKFLAHKDRAESN